MTFKELMRREALAAGEELARRPFGPLTTAPAKVSLRSAPPARHRDVPGMRP